MLKDVRFTIGNKVLASVLFVAIAFCSLSGYTFWKINQIEQGYDGLLFRSVPLVFDVKDMSTELRSQASLVNGYLLTGDKAYITEYQASKQKMQQLFADLDKNLTTPEGKQKIAELKVSVAKYNEVTEKSIDIRTQKGINDSLVAMSEAGAINRDTQQKMESFVTFLSDRMELRVKQNEDNQNAIERVIVILDIIIIIFAVIIALWLARKISSPLNMVLKEANKIAGGDLTKANIKYNGNDEIGDMIKAFDNMSTSLRELIQKTTAASAHVADSSFQLTEGAEQSAQASVVVAESITQVSAGADQQVTAVAGAVAIVEEMSDSIIKVVKNADMVSETSQKASDTATQGEKVIDQAVRQMVNAEQTVLDSANTIAELGARSQEIGQIVETISGIAGQTNLLALNAAIEAARAGEQGRGFAVVAEEVRKLAEQSQEAAKKIADMIARIQGDTEKAVQVMNKGKQEVQSGAGLVQNAGSAFKDIRESVDIVSLQVNDIASAINMLSDGSKQIIGAVREIEVVSKETAAQAQSVSAATEEQSASMEEISASSHALRQMADQLREEVSRFRL